MKGGCEICRTALASDGEAWICSYECTYCRTCRDRLDKCPNCAGELVLRPRRTTGAAQIASRLPSRLLRRVTNRH